MINKLYVKTKKFIKENYKELIFLLVLCTVFFYPLDYSIMVSGGTIDIKNRVSIENSHNIKGSYNLAYVSEHRGTPMYVLLSYLIPSWTKVPIEDYQANKNETNNDIMNRAKVYLEYSKQAAIKNAYSKAEKSFEIKSSKFYIVYILEGANTNIKAGDIIKKADNIEINNLYQYKEIIAKHNIGDKINVTVIRDGKEVQCYAEIRQIENEKLSGITILELYDYISDPKITFSFKNNESGSSGGLMLALSIYDKLTEKDLTRGRKIVGTGTIDFDGSVGEIDGIEYKLKGAVKSKADIFIAPSGENYKKVIELKKKNNYKIKIIEAKSFEYVLEELEK